jgi:hypothetical protein
LWIYVSTHTILFFFQTLLILLMIIHFHWPLIIFAQEGKCSLVIRTIVFLPNQNVNSFFWIINCKVLESKSSIFLINSVSFMRFHHINISSNRKSSSSPKIVKATAKNVSIFKQIWNMNLISN